MFGVLASPAGGGTNSQTCHNVTIGSSARLSDGNTHGQSGSALCLRRSISSIAAGANGALCVRRCFVCAPGRTQNPGSLENCSQTARMLSPGLHPLIMMSRTQTAEVLPGY